MKIRELLLVPSFDREESVRRGSIGDSRHVPEQFNSSGNIVAASSFARASRKRRELLSDREIRPHSTGSYSTGRDPKPVLPDRGTLGDCVRDVGEVMVRRGEAKTSK